jgi:hypothetical protein
MPLFRAVLFMTVLLVVWGLVKSWPMVHAMAMP